MPDVYDNMAAIAGEAAGLRPEQFPGFAHILRQVATEEREACAKFVEDTYRNEEGEALRARFVVPEAKDGYLEAWHQASDVAAAIRNRIDLSK